MSFGVRLIRSVCEEYGAVDSRITCGCIAAAVRKP